MKQKSIQFLLFGFLIIGIMNSSCNRPGQKLFTVVPSNTAMAGTFNPGELIQKADTNHLNSIKNALGNIDLLDELFENPEMTGIEFNSYSGFFVFGEQQKYIGLVMPIKKQADLEIFLEKLSEKTGNEFEKEIGENFTCSGKGKTIMAWNKSVFMILGIINGWDNTSVKTKAAELFNLEAEDCILSQKDFKTFLSNQKEMNIWLTSNQIASMTGNNMGMLNMLGAINNNYAHINLDFQDKAIVLSSNLRMNPDFKKSIDKYNFIDLNAEKDILKMLPAENLILAGNFRLNPDRVIEILNAFGSGDQLFLNEFEKETGRKPEEILKSIHGSFAFSINGISKVKTENAEETDSCERIPVMVAAMKLNDDQFVKDFIEIVKLQEPIIEKDGYYIIKAEEVPFFMGVKDKVILLSNEEKYLSEILAGGKVKNNVLTLDISKALFDNPICLYMNLDKDSYSPEMSDFLEDEIDEKLAMGMEGFGKSLKYLTITGNIEKTEVRIELKEK